MDSSFNVCVSVILSVPCSLVVTCQDRTDLLVTLFSCFFLLTHMVSWVRFGM